LQAKYLRDRSTLPEKVGVFGELGASDLVFADGFIRQAADHRSIHLWAERDRLLGGPAVPLKAFGQDSGPISPNSFALEFLRASSDVVHQRSQPPPRERLALTLGYTLRRETAGDFGPARAVLTVHALELVEIVPDDLGSPCLNFSYRRGNATSFELLHVGAQTFQIDTHDADTYRPEVNGTTPGTRAATRKPM
jgi:hypothetical protein